MTDVVIVAATRTPIGRFMGVFSGLSAVDLGTIAVQSVMKRTEIDPSSGIIDEVLMGQVLQAGSGQNPARQVALGAGLPVSTPSTTINKVCGSSLKAVMIAASAIRAGEHACIIAGGMESMSNAPHLFLDGRSGTKVGHSKMLDSMIHDGLWDVYNDEHMGCTGETIARECGISREDADAFAISSQQKATSARDQGFFNWEITPVSIPISKREPILVDSDEGIRSDTNAEGLSRLRPAFDLDGVVTAGNASTLNDGASAVMVCSSEFASKHNLKSLVRIVDYTTSGVEPARVMYAPVPAIHSLLDNQGLSVLDVDLYEHNEAFATASCAIVKEIGIPMDRFNVHGGAISLGHPLGASGTRCLTTLIGAMRQQGALKGLVTLCLGGGNAVAMLVEQC